MTAEPTEETHPDASTMKEEVAGCLTSAMTICDENLCTGGLNCFLPSQEAGPWEGWSDPLHSLQLQGRDLETSGLAHVLYLLNKALNIIIQIRHAHHKTQVQQREAPNFYCGPKHTSITLGNFEVRVSPDDFPINAGGMYSFTSCKILQSSVESSLCNPMCTASIQGGPNGSQTPAFPLSVVPVH